jgi:uncharacterized UPF0160 family protein
MMINITEEMGFEKEWYAEANKIKLKDLEEFITRLIKQYDHDYGTIVKAMCAGMMATMSAMNKDEKQGGITGFQASCLMWELMKHFNLRNNKCGAKLINYDDMLYPQKFEDFTSKAITTHIWESLKKEAEKNIKERSDNCHPDVLKHWEDIVNGIVPFGYYVRD